AAVASPTVAYATLVPAFVVAGIGMSLFFAPVANMVLGSVRREEEGIASGANNAIRELGGVFGVAVLGAVFSARGGYTSGAALVTRVAPAGLGGGAGAGRGAPAAPGPPPPRPGRAPAPPPPSARAPQRPAAVPAPPADAPPAAAAPEAAAIGAAAGVTAAEAEPVPELDLVR